MFEDYQEALREFTEDVEKHLDDVWRKTDAIWRLIERDQFARSFGFSEFHVLKALEKLQKKGRAYCSFRTEGGETVRYWRRSDRWKKRLDGSGQFKRK